MFRRLEAPQSLRDSSLKEGASGETGKRYGLPGNFSVMPRALPLGELASPTGLDGRSPYPDHSFSRTTRDSSPKWEQAHPQALRFARKLCHHAKGSPFGRAGKPYRA